MAKNLLTSYEGDLFVKKKLGLGGTSAYSYGQNFIGKGSRSLDGLYGSGRQISVAQSKALRKPLINKFNGVLNMKLERPRVIARLRQWATKSR
jgi:hypothetical protein